MNILLDTHAFLWFVDDNPRLSQPARVLIESEDSRPFLTPLPQLAIQPASAPRGWMGEVKSEEEEISILGVLLK